MLPSLRELSLLYSSRGIACPLVLVTRVREPLEYYLSFYRWGRWIPPTRQPGAYGATFLEWVERVPNLQSTMMVQSMASYHAEYLPKRYRANYEANIIVGGRRRWPGGGRGALLDEFAIVGTKLLRCAAQPSTSWTWAHRPAPSHPRPGTMERFDETMLMAHDLVGLRLIPYRQNRPGMKNGYRKSINAVCPDMAACRSAVRRVAPRDHMMYDRYGGASRQRFGPLVRSLAVALHYTRRQSPPPSRRGDARLASKTYCRFQQERRPTGSHWRDLRCPYGATTRRAGGRSRLAVADGGAGSVAGDDCCDRPYPRARYGCVRRRSLPTNI